MRCHRCAAPLEHPVTFADEICGPYREMVDGVCDHVPLCVECVDEHVREVIDAIEWTREHEGADVPLTDIERTGRSEDT